MSFAGVAMESDEKIRRLETEKRHLIWLLERAEEHVIFESKIFAKEIRDYLATVRK